MSEKVEAMIRDNEQRKTKMFSTPGKDFQFFPSDVHYQPIPFNVNNNYVHSAMVDETYMLVASHLDEAIIKKIENSEYVDFAKLIPRDRVVAMDSEETELKSVIREGKTYYVPVKESTAITGFGKREQAFRVFSNIYTRTYPGRATELIQYNHTIHTASLNYVWSNVYGYDQDFRIHMSKHPTRSWSTLLQQSWSMQLQEKIRYSDFHKSLGNHKSVKGKSGEQDQEALQAC